MGHMGGLINSRAGADNTEPVFQIPVGLPGLERGRRVKKRSMTSNFEPYNRYGIFPSRIV